MQVELQAHIAFHLTGKMPQGEVDALAQSDLHPAVLAEYRDLTALRYDFPLVLMGGAAKPVQSLSALFDGALKEIAAGDDGDRVRKHAIRLEREIRKLVAEGVAGALFELYDAAAARIGAKKDQLLQDSLSRLRAALKTDGAVVDCDQAMPFRLFQHAWQALQDQKARNFRTDINKLVMKLSDILSADFIRSKEGLSADRLRASVGSAHQSTFDFDAMSRVLAKSSPSVPMPESRRQRVRGLLTALRTQRFFPPAGEGDKWIGVAEPYSFVFDTCADAVAAYRERLPKMTELAKAMAMAKLETEGEYSEARHDAFFAGFGDNGLDPDDIAAFPDYLICLRAADFRAAESDLILRAFAAGMPAKLVVQTDDLIEQSPIRDDYLVAGLRGKQLASTAIGFGASLCHAGEQREPVPAARAGAARAGLSRAGNIQRFLRRQRRQHAAVHGGGGGHGIAGFSGFHLRSIGGAGLGVAVFPSRQQPGRPRLAVAAPRLRGRAAAACIGNPCLHARRLRRLRPALRQIFRQGPARQMDGRFAAGRRIPGA